MLARLNKTITLPAVLFFLLSTVNQLPAETSQRTVTLQKMQCGSGDIETINRQILNSKIDSDAILILPEGEFNVAALTVEGVSNFTLQGTVEPATGDPATTLSFSGTSGITLQRINKVKIENLKATGPEDAILITLQKNTDTTSSDMVLSNYLSSVGGGETYQYCFTDFSWFVPLAGLMLF